MPDLIWFEWEKCPDGYTIEELRPEHLRFERTKIHEPFEIMLDEIGAEITGVAPSGERIVGAKPTEVAPPWLHELFQDFSALKTSEVAPLDYWLKKDGPLSVFIPKSKRILRYQPLTENSAAFMEYGDCADSAENALAFFDKYGCPFKPMDDIATNRISSVRLDILQDAAKTMADAIQLWEQAKQRNDYIDLIHLVNEPVNPPDPSPEQVFRSLPKESPSRHYRLEQRLRPNPGHTPKLYLTTDSLEGALWLQFSQAVTGDVQLRKCAVCPSWFSYGTGTGRRKSAQYCTDRCRKADHYQRKVKSK